MLRGYWLSIFAVVGWLTAFPLSAEEAKPDQPKSQGENQAEDHKSFEPSIPIRILENPKKSEADKRQEQEDTKREIEDLAAQKTMAKATEDIVWYTKLQLILAALGTAVLLYSLALTRMATSAAVNATEAAQNDLKLAHPPKLRITRPLIFLPPEKISIMPKFVSGERFCGMAFVENYGRFDATIRKVENSKWGLDADCYFFFSKGGVIPLAEAHIRRGKAQDWPPIDFYYGDKGTEKISSGNFASWGLSAEVPKDFKKRNGKWSHTLFMIGHVRYLGALKDARGYYFCKRYDPKRQCFVSVEDYEVED
jgi:hypothetical protein